MKPIKCIGWILMVAVLCASCASNKKALQRGEYYTAAMEAIRQLRSNPNNTKQQQILLQAYPLLEENSLRKIKNANESNAPDKYCIAADEYLALNRVADAIYTCPKALQLIPQPEQYSRHLGEMLPKAAAEAYQLGDKNMNVNTIQSAREAYRYYLKTNEYVEGYRDVNAKIAMALNKATLKVVVQKPITPQRYQLSSDFFYDNLMAQITRVTGDTFVRFYTEEEANGERLTRPDHYLALDFADFTVGAMKETKNTVEVNRDSVLVGTTNVNGRSQDVYGKVKADFTTLRREVISQGTLSVRIINASNDRVEQNRNVQGKFVWFNEWATYKGDERALTDRQKKMANTEPLMPPPQQDLFIEFTKPIFDQTVSFIKNYYRDK